MDRRLKYEEKRVRIYVNLREKEQAYFMKKMGKIPNAAELRDILMGREIKIISYTENPQYDLILKNLRRIGNNINQISRTLNANEAVNNDYIQRTLEELEEEIKKIKE